jgi:putative aldouronate transport system permease protein
VNQLVRGKTVSSRISELALIVVLIGISFASLAPLWYTVAVSFSEKAAAAAGFVTFWPIGFNTISYTKILADPVFLNAFWVSVKRVLLGGGLNFILTVLMAYPLSKTVKHFRFRNAYMWFLIFNMLFSGGIIPQYILMKQLGLFNSIWALVLPTAVPVFNVILLVNFFRSIPGELSEAAYMDGAGPWYTLFKVYLPLSMPALATVTLFSIVGHWNAFFDGLIYMRNEANYPLQTYIQQLVVQLNVEQVDSQQLELLSKMSNQTLNAAKIVVSMVPILLIYPFLQRYFIHGIMLGSVKE